MSFTGKKTPLALNVESSLSQNTGFRLNPVANSYQGTWTAAQPYITPTTSTYTQGSVTQSTVLDKLTRALPNFYNITPSMICIPVWRNLLSIGRPRDSRAGNNRINLPALGNSRPDTFISTYAGWGTFKNSTSTDKFYNTVIDSKPGLTDSIYPPYRYPISGSYSYVYKNWSSLSASPGAPNDCTQTTFTPWTDSYQYYSGYSWITGWPAVNNAWQEKISSMPQVAADPDGDGDTYAGAYYPRPDLAPTQPWRARDLGKIEYDEYFRHGFVATVARQAYYEFWSDYNTRRTNQYLEFMKYFQQCWNYKESTNKLVTSYQESKTFLKGNYSNINDLTTSDISGVNMAFRDWGNDMIRLGKSVDLATIDQFGLPSKLLLNLQKWNALTAAVKFALLLNDLTSEQVSNILLPTYIPTPAEERKIYTSLGLVQGDDLEEVKIILNCVTPGLVSLADLIDPLKMFPESYSSLTVPQYSIDAPSAKVYQLIYNGSGVNTTVQNWGSYLEGILPADKALACGAFMMSMNQIKNIKTIDFEKFSQVVANLEVTNKDLPLINSNEGTPGSVTLASDGASLLGQGSGWAGTFRMCDFLGAAAGYPYNSWWVEVQNGILALQTTELLNVYTKLYQLSLGNGWALLSKGKGYTDPYINPAPPVPALRAYDLFRITAPAAVGDTTVTCTAGVADILNPGDLITFNTADSITPPPTNNTYTVVSTTSNTITFTSAAPGPYTGWPGLSTALSAGVYIYTSVASYGGYPNTIPQPGAVQDLVDAANLEILRIQSTNQVGAERLAYWWGKVGSQLAVEQRAIPLAVPQTTNVYGGSTPSDIDTFVVLVERWAQETTPGGAAPILEALSDTTVIGGQSLVGALREARNGARIINTGGELDNDVPDTADPQRASAQATVVDGVITSVEVTSGGTGYEQCCECGVDVAVYPKGGVFGGTGDGAVLQSVVDPLGSVSGVTVVSGGSGYTGPVDIYFNPPPETVRLGGPAVPGSFSGSPYTGQDPVPDNLVAPVDSSYTPDEAARIAVSGS